MASNSAKKPAKPAGNPKPPVQEVQLEGGNTAFMAEIEKSRSMIETADKPAEKPKNKGGRPSNEEKAAKEAEKRAQAAAELSAAVPPEGLKSMIALPFGLAALQTGFDGFHLTDQEAAALTPGAHALLLTYAPQVKGENLALMAFAGALFSIGVSKYVAYINFRKQGSGSRESAPPADHPNPSPASETSQNLIPVGIETFKV